MSKDPEDLSRRAHLAADQAVEQFKLKAPILAACPDCGQRLQVEYAGPPADNFLTRCECSRSNHVLRGVLGPPEWVRQRRDDVVSKAARASVLDAVFHAMYFNEKGHGEYFGCVLDPAELLTQASANVIADAAQRSRRLYSGANAYIGAAFFKYPGESMTFEQAVAKLRNDNPGFSDEVYDIVIHDSIRGMR